MALVNFTLAHRNSVEFLRITIANADEVLELATEHTPEAAIKQVQLAVQKAEEIITSHHGKEINLSMMNELRRADINIGRAVTKVKMYERYQA